MSRILTRQKEYIKERDAIINELMEENKGWEDRVSRFLSQEADIPGKNVVPTLEAKIEKLTLENDVLNSKLLTLSLELKRLHISEKEKHDKWNKELNESRIALKKENFKRIVPTKKILGYKGEASTNHVVQPPNAPLRTTVVQHDVKMQTLYQKLQGPMRKGFDFVKHKFFKPFRPGYSKYFNDVKHRAC